MEKRSEVKKGLKLQRGYNSLFQGIVFSVAKRRREKNTNFSHLVFLRVQQAEICIRENILLLLRLLRSQKGYRCAGPSLSRVHERTWERKVSDSESVRIPLLARIGKCQNRKVYQNPAFSPNQKVLELESVRNGN